MKKTRYTDGDEIVRRVGFCPVDNAFFGEYLMRYVFLQSFTKAEDGESLTGILRVSRDWSVFQDHFPGFPILPGALIIETMAQHSVALMMDYNKKNEPVMPTLIQVDRAKFMVPVIPDCDLEIQVFKKMAMFPNFKFECNAYVDSQAVASSVLTMAFKPMESGQGLNFMAFFMKGGMS